MLTAWGAAIARCDDTLEPTPLFPPLMPANRSAKRRNQRGGNRTNIALPKVRHVAIIAVPPARMLDVVGPAEVSDVWARSAPVLLLFCLLRLLSNRCWNPSLKA